MTHIRKKGKGGGVIQSRSYFYRTVKKSFTMSFKHLAPHVHAQSKGINTGNPLKILACITTRTAEQPLSTFNQDVRLNLIDHLLTTASLHYSHQTSKFFHFSSHIAKFFVYRDFVRRSNLFELLSTVRISKGSKYETQTVGSLLLASASFQDQHTL